MKQPFTIKAPGGPGTCAAYGRKAIGIVVSGPTLLEYRKYRENKEIEERFPDFLRDITENIKTGMTLTQAITATKDTYYGVLTPYVKKFIW